MSDPSIDASARGPMVPRWALYAAAAVVIAQCAAFHGVRRDDAFISYRYAQNLANGVGLVFNPGERIMASTSAGHVLLAAAVHRVVGDELLPSFMSALGCIGWTAQALAIGALLQRALPLAAAWLIALAVALGAGRAEEHVCLETTIAAGLLCWALCAGVYRRWFWAAALSALAGLFRPDMYVAAVLLGGLCLWELRAKALRPMLLFIALALPWYLFAQAYFGKVLPQSAAAKFQRRQLSEYALWELKQNGALGLPFSHHVAIDVVACALSVIGAVLLVRRDRRLWIVPLWLVLHNAAYLWLRPFTHAWHLYPVAALSAVLMLAALTMLIDASPWPRARSLALLPLVAFALVYGQRALEFARTHEHGAWHGSRDHVYRDTARYLRTHARPNDIVASVEVGTIAYYTNLRMYDWGGLVTPNAVFRPTQPRLNWAVIDMNFEELRVGLAPIKELQQPGFVVSIYNFELMETAVARIARSSQAFRLRRLKSDLRASFAHEVTALGRSLEHSGLRIDAFLARAATAPR
jgi:hypothetical protein